MANVVVVGSQWGDEGKGKIVDWLSEQADVVVRFQGGHNAGHTLVIEGITYKLALLPSGVVRPGKLSVIGNGAVVDPHHLVHEMGRPLKAWRSPATICPSQTMPPLSCRCTARWTKCVRIPTASASARPGAASA